MNLILRTGSGSKGTFVISEEPGHVVTKIFLQQLGGDQVANIDFSDTEFVSVKANPFTTGWEPIQLSCFVDVPPLRPLNYTLDLTDRWVEQEDGPVCTDQSAWTRPRVERHERTYYSWDDTPPQYNSSRISMPDTDGSIISQGEGYITIDDCPRPSSVISRDESGFTTVATRDESGMVTIRCSVDTEEPEPQPERPQEENVEMFQRLNAIREMLEGRIEADREGEQNAERN